MKAVAYVRVSTAEQAESRAGVNAQLDSIRRRYPEVLVFSDEGVSGASALADRPGLLDALGALEPGDVLVVAKRDRLARDMVVAALVEREVAKRGAAIVSAAGEGSDSEGPEGFLVRRMMDLLAEYERMLIVARTRAAMKAKKARGEVVGRVPFGKRRDGKDLVDSPEEIAVVYDMSRLRAGGFTFRQIARKLGPHPRTGRPWSHSQVLRMLEGKR